MDNFMLAEAKEKGNLLNKMISIIQELANNEIADTDSEDESESIVNVKDLIIKSRNIVNDRWFETLK